MSDPNSNFVVLKNDDSKRAYQAPKLLSYGSFQTLTLGATGTKNDGGGRLTKPSVAL